MLLLALLLSLNQNNWGSYPIDIPQWLEAKLFADSNKEIPTITTEGVSVKGVMKRRSKPIRPEF